MFTENGFGIMGFFSKGCMENITAQLTEKENLFIPNRKSYEVKVHLSIVVNNGPIFQFSICLHVLK